MSNTTQSQSEPSQHPEQIPAVLEEDDEFEDFPVEGRFIPFLFFPVAGCTHLLHSHTFCPDGKSQPNRVYFSLDWPQEEAEQAANGNTVHLWEESWDDDDAAEDFSKQLKYVLHLLPPQHTYPLYHKLSTLYYVQVTSDTNRCDIPEQRGTQKGRSGALVYPSSSTPRR